MKQLPYGPARGLFNVFSRKAKLFELRFFTRKTFHY